MKETCDSCLKEKDIKYRVHLLDGYLDVCSRTYAREEYNSAFKQNIEEL